MQNTPRFLVNRLQINNNRFKITDSDQTKKIKQVLRLKAQDKILLFDGIGNEYMGELEIVSNDVVSGSITEKSFVEKESSLNITLAQALPKAGKLDDIVKMCTEVGVNRFIFFESDYSIPKLKDYKLSKIERLKKISEEATRQSERSTLPEFLELTSFSQLIKIEGYDKRFLLSTHPQLPRKDIKEVKNELLQNGQKNILVMVGAEGGFSPKELQASNDEGIVLVSMNLPILRTETAGVVTAGFLLI